MKFEADLSVQRTVTGAGSGGTDGRLRAGNGRQLGLAPVRRCGGGRAAAAAEAVAVSAGGGPPGITTTRVPTLTRSNRSETSSFSMPMQPDETNLPIVEGWLVPWMR